MTDNNPIICRHRVGGSILWIPWTGDDLGIMI